MQATIMEVFITGTIMQATMQIITQAIIMNPINPNPINPNHINPNPKPTPPGTNVSKNWQTQNPRQHETT